VRDASTFCGAVTKGAPEHVAQMLGSAEGALTAVADSLARHFADWGAVSRFAIGGETPRRTTDSAQPLDTDEPLRFEEHVKPLFRERDRDSMRFAFDLWSPEDVSVHADAILDRLETGTMPWRRSMACRAHRRLPPLDSRRQARVGRDCNESAGGDTHAA
jgi:hypothetical protein